MEIRAARPDDAADIARLHVEARQFHDALGYRQEGACKRNGGRIPFEMLRYSKDLG